MLNPSATELAYLPFSQTPGPQGTPVRLEMGETMRTLKLGIASLGLLIVTAIAGTGGTVEAHHGNDFAPESDTHFVIAWNQNYDGFHEDDPGQTGGTTEAGIAEQSPGGNATCTSGSALLKLDPPSNGTFTLSDGSKIIISNFDGKTFDWEIHEDSLDDIDASVVLVKGGPATMAYFYADGDEDADTMLTAPLNPNSGRLYGISHISFCFDPKNEIDNPFT